jgi:hypothetical protein
MTMRAVSFYLLGCYQETPIEPQLRLLDSDRTKLDSEGTENPL